MSRHEPLKLVSHFFCGRGRGQTDRVRKKERKRSKEKRERGGGAFGTDHQLSQLFEAVS